MKLSERIDYDNIQKMLEINRIIESLFWDHITPKERRRIRNAQMTIREVMQPRFKKFMETIEEDI